MLELPPGRDQCARDIAAATGAGLSTVEAWLARVLAPHGARAERLLELAAIVARGEYRRVAELLAELETPSF